MRVSQSLVKRVWLSLGLISMAAPLIAPGLTSDPGRSGARSDSRVPVVEKLTTRSSHFYATRRASTVTPPARMSDAYGRLPIAFEANLGQAEPGVRFLTRGSGYGLYLTPAEAVLAKAKQATDGTPGDKASKGRDDSLRLKLVGADSRALMSGADKLTARTNYFIGNDPKKWRTAVANFARVKCEKVYPGIDLIYYGNHGELEYDFIVAPGANPRAIRFSFTGARAVCIDAAGDLLVSTAAARAFCAAKQSRSRLGIPTECYRRPLALRDDRTAELRSTAGTLTVELAIGGCDNCRSPLSMPRARRVTDSNIPVGTSIPPPAAREG